MTCHASGTKFAFNGGTPAPGAERVMPKLTKFVSADYPAEARTQGLVADVVLGLTIDETGKVSEADALEPAGHGFCRPGVPPRGGA